MGTIVTQQMMETSAFCVALIVLLLILKEIFAFVRSRSVRLDRRAGDADGPLPPPGCRIDAAAKGAIFETQRTVEDVHDWLKPGPDGVQHWRESNQELVGSLNHVAEEMHGLVHKLDENNRRFDAVLAQRGTPVRTGDDR